MVGGWVGGGRLAAKVALLWELACGSFVLVQGAPWLSCGTEEGQAGDWAKDWGGRVLRWCGLGGRGWGCNASPPCLPPLVGFTVGHDRRLRMGAGRGSTAVEFECPLAAPPCRFRPRFALAPHGLLQMDIEGFEYDVVRLGASPEGPRGHVLCVGCALASTFEALNGLHLQKQTNVQDPGSNAWGGGGGFWGFGDFY